MQKIQSVLRRFFYSGGTPEQLGLLRIWIGIGLLPFHSLQFGYLKKLDPEGASWYFLDPIWYFNILGIHSIDVQTAYTVFVVLIVSTIGFSLGLFTRSSLVIMLISIVILKGMRDSTVGDVHHRYLIPFHVLLMFLFSRAHQVYSIDAWRKRQKGVVESIANWEASWPIKSAQLYCSAFYLWSGIAKLRMSGWEWATAERLKELFLIRSVRNGFENGVPTHGSELAYDMAHNELVTGLLAQSTYLFELGFPVILFIRNVYLRLLFFVGVTFFHVANYYLIGVQFLYLPVMFLIFFDVSSLLRERGWIPEVPRSNRQVRASLSRNLAVYWLVLWTAVVIRIDRFPLSWAPMYSVWSRNEGATKKVKHIDKKHLKEKGFSATHRDGTQSWISKKDLNIRTSSMRRMYYRRMHRRGSPNDGHYNHDSGTIDRWLWGLEPEEPYYFVNLHRRMFESFNKTFGHHPGDPEFIVKLEAPAEKYVFDRKTLELVGTKDFSSEAIWNEAWAEDFWKPE